jgi:dimethylhistidine N-methyltransferase
MKTDRERSSQFNNVTFDDQHPCQSDSQKELLHGLVQVPKTISPKYFYDAKGSELFDQITRLPEYYPSRTEMGILSRYSKQIAAHCGANCVLIEPGSGSSEKVRLLLEAIKPCAYVPLDISGDFLFQSALKLGREFPWLRVHAVCADFGHNWELSKTLPDGKRIIFYPGSTIGNLEPADAISFLGSLRGWIGHDGGMLIGVDLHKSESVLNAAYNDAAGVTAAFNLNVLNHINPLLGANFDSEKFAHCAFYNNSKQRIEMHLKSKHAHTVQCNGNTLSFKQGESIHTENSYKYTLESFATLAAQAGLTVEKTWLDDEQLFSVHYLQPN